MPFIFSCLWTSLETCCSKGPAYKSKLKEKFLVQISNAETKTTTFLRELHGPSSPSPYFSQMTAMKDCNFL